MFGDPRAPDLVVKLKKGTIDSISETKWAEHGSFAHDDSHVGLVVSNPALPAVITATVRTKQVAPTILAAVGLDPRMLDAVVAEGTSVLRGLSFTDRRTLP
jgi:hypothetical protein